MTSEVYQKAKDTAQTKDDQLFHFKRSHCLEIHLTIHKLYLLKQESFLVYCIEDIYTEISNCNRQATSEILKYSESFKCPLFKTFWYKSISLYILEGTCNTEKILHVKTKFRCIQTKRITLNSLFQTVKHIQSIQLLRQHANLLILSLIFLNI